MLVNAPLTKDTEKEVHTDTDEISDDVMSDVVKAVLARVKKVDRDHDIPYIAGYSQNGEIVYIDRHMPRSFSQGRRRIETDRFIILHEMVEKALLDELALHYVHAHQIALRTERAAVEAAGIKWAAYNDFTQKHGKGISDERLTKVPSDLDLTPYRDERDFKLLQQVVSAIQVEE